MHLAYLLHFFDRGAPNFFLRVVTEPRRPLVMQSGEVARFLEANWESVRKKIERELGRNSVVEQGIDRGKNIARVGHEGLESSWRFLEQHWNDHVGLTAHIVRVQHRARPRRHTMPLILRIGGMR